MLASTMSVMLARDAMVPVALARVASRVSMSQPVMKRARWAWRGCLARPGEEAQW